MLRRELLPVVHPHTIRVSDHGARGAARAADPSPAWRASRRHVAETSLTLLRTWGPHLAGNSSKEARSCAPSPPAVHSTAPVKLR